MLSSNNVEGKLSRVSWETLAAGQALSAETGWTLEAAVVGSGIANLAAEVAGKKVSKVYAVESPKLEPYTPDAFVAALKQVIQSKQPKLVLLPHTYQVRDFIPKLATAMERTVISDCVGYKKDGGQVGIHAANVSGKVYRGRELHLRSALVCNFSKWGISRGQSRGRKHNRRLLKR